MSNDTKIPDPFPLDFDIEEDPCLVCDGELDSGWICMNCGADHFEGVMLLIGYGSPKKSPHPRQHGAER